MEEKLTDELLNELLLTKSIKKYIGEEAICMDSLSEHLNKLLKQKCLKKNEIIKRSELNTTFAYQIFSGDRNPTRNKVLQLAFAMQLDLRETQRLLKISGVNELYCKNRRDAIIIYCIINKSTLFDTENTLFEFNELGILKE